MATPRISVVLPVRNAVSILPGTLDSLRAQTLRDFEIVVVDGQSIDGTLDLLRAASDDLPIKLVSEPDRSVADALAKGLARATGDIVGILCADERYYPYTLAQVAAWFEAAPGAAVCGGRLDFMDDHEATVDSLLTEPFDVEAHLNCEQVASILASFFNRRLIGPDFYYLSDAPTCPEYELWARLGFRFSAQAFKRHDVSIAKTFRNRLSMSFRAESFDQFTADKLFYLDGLLEKFVPADRRAAVRRRAAAGIHMWAAEQLHAIDPLLPDIYRHCEAAAREDPGYGRIAPFVARTGRARYDAATGRILRTVPDHPGPESRKIEAPVSIVFDRQHKGVRVLGNNPLTLRTSDDAWGYSFKFRVPPQAGLPAGRAWLRLQVEVESGAVGLAPMSGNDVIGERVVRNDDGRLTVDLPLARDLATNVMLRSGGVGGSVVRIHATELLVDPGDQAAA